MAFSQDFIEKVRDANNIVDILGEFTTFKRSSGGQHMGCCPLPGHNEKTASFSVSETKQLYHCFGCGQSGNTFDALRELKNQSFPEAVEYLANRASIPIPDEMRGGGKRDSNKELRSQMNKVNQSASHFYHKTLMELPADHPVRVYVRDRGLTKEVVEDFQIGYAEDSWDLLQKHLIKSKLPLELADKLGLQKKRKTGDGSYDMFRHRLMFTIQNHVGDYVGFGGRSLEKDQMPKYINSSDSEIFHKSKVLYGLNQTGKFIREKDQVIVVEGYMDFLALYKVGIRNVVATLGTALTEQHARLLKRFTKNILVFFDGDSAGQKAANRSLPVLLIEGLIPKALVIEEGFDPDDFVKKFGADKLTEKLEKAPELFIWQLEKLMESYQGTAADKVRVMDEVKPALESIQDSRLRSIYSEEVAKRLGVESRLVGSDVRVKPREETPVTQMPPQPVKANEELIQLSKASKAEIYLLNLALSGSERWSEIWDTEVLGEMIHPGIKAMFAKAHEFLLENSNSFDKLTAYLMTLTDSRKELGLHLTEAFIKLGTEERNKMQSDSLKRVRDHHMKNKMREITARMRNQTAQEQLKELEQIVNMKKGNNTSNT